MLELIELLFCITDGYFVILFVEIGFLEIHFLYIFFHCYFSPPKNKYCMGMDLKSQNIINKI